MDRNMLLQHKLTHSHKTSRKFRAEQYWWRTHGGLRSRKAGFDSRVGGSRAVLFRLLSSECDGRAHDLAKVGDQVRFLARTWPCDGLSKRSGRRSLTARRRSAKP